MILIIIFWILVFLLFYIYLGYPILIRLLYHFRRKLVIKANIFPFISVIIPVHNEDKYIHQKILNTLASNYPKEKIEVIVVSDASSDDTDTIVAQHCKENSNFRLIRLPQRSGKTVAKNRGIQASQGEILIFTDASSQIAKDGISNLVKNFNDPTVGCVSSEDINVDQSGLHHQSGESNYVNFDMKLRRQESAVNSLVGNSGCFYAVRRKFCVNFPPYIIRDFATALLVSQQGFRAVHESDAKVFVNTLNDVSKEFKRKVRTVVGGISTLFSFWRVLNPFKYRLYTWQLISHKLLRWLEPFILALLFLINLVLIKTHSIYLLTEIMFLSYLFINIVLMIFPKFSVKNSFFKLSQFLFISHLAVVTAWINYFKGNRMVIWQPSRS